MTNLILASTSRYRKALLERLGVPFHCIVPEVDEAAWKTADRTVREVAVQLARAKAEAITRRFPDAIVIGSDQAAECDGQLLDKPGSLENARDQLQRMSSKSHFLHTAMCVIGPSNTIEHCDTTRLAMRRLTDAEIERYLAIDEPFDCAGSYKLECRGVTLFKSIETADQTAIIGLPLISLTTILRELGFSIP